MPTTNPLGYPCVRIDNLIHITKNGSRCFCGARYKYATQEKGQTVAVPLLWRTAIEVSCPSCRAIAMDKEKSLEKQP